MTIQEDVRLLIPDLGAGTDQIFTETQIDSFVALGGSDALLATALALEVIATNEALTYKYVKTDDLTVDGVKGANLILERAKSMRQMAADIALTDAFQIIFPPVPRVKPEAAPWDYLP